MSSSGKQASQPVLKTHRYHPFKDTIASSQPVSQSPLTGYTSVEHQVQSGSSGLSALASHPILDCFGYRFHKSHRILICVACEFAVIPSSALGHANSQHNISSTQDEKANWNNLVTKLNVTTQTSISPPSDRQPVELLQIHSDAYCCNLCNYGTLTSRSFSNHWSANHRSSNDISPDERYHRGHVQTFFPHINRRYFQVDPPIPNSTPLFDIYMKKEVPTYEAFDVTIPAAPREIPPLLYQTRWHDHLEAYITDKGKRRTLATLAHPTQYTKCPLWKLVWHYISAFVDVGKNSSMRVRCILVEYPR